MWRVWTADVRFRCIHGLGRVSDVLSAVEDSESQATQEIPRRKQAGHRSEAETGARLQKLRNFFQLGNIIFAETTVLFQKWENVIVLVAGVGLIQGLQVLEHRPPRFLLFLCVLHSGDGLPMSIVVGNVSKVLPSCSVHRIFKTRVIRIQFRSVAENLIGKSVQLLNGFGEPGHCVFLLVPGELVHGGANVMSQDLDDV